MNQRKTFVHVFSSDLIRKTMGAVDIESQLCDAKCVALQLSNEEHICNIRVCMNLPKWKKI